MEDDSDDVRITRWDWFFVSFVIVYVLSSWMIFLCGFWSHFGISLIATSLGEISAKEKNGNP